VHGGFTVNRFAANNFAGNIFTADTLTGKKREAESLHLISEVMPVKEEFH
jgi:hypothetical protein